MFRHHLYYTNYVDLYITRAFINTDLHDKNGVPFIGIDTRLRQDIVKHPDQSRYISRSLIKNREENSISQYIDVDMFIQILRFNHKKLFNPRHLKRYKNNHILADGSNNLAFRAKLVHNDLSNLLEFYNPESGKEFFISFKYPLKPSTKRFDYIQEQKLEKDYLNAYEDKTLNDLDRIVSEIYLSGYRINRKSYTWGYLILSKTSLLDKYRFNMYNTQIIRTHSYKQGKILSVIKDILSIIKDFIKANIPGMLLSTSELAMSKDGIIYTIDDLFNMMVHHMARELYLNGVTINKDEKDIIHNNYVQYVKYRSHK